MTARVAWAALAVFVSAAPRAGAMSPQTRHDLVVRGLELDARGNAREAVPLLRKAAWHAGASSDSLTLYLARSLVHLGTIEGRAEAVRLYRTVLYHRPGDVPARRELAKLEDLRGFRSHAKQDFEEIVKQHPDDASAAYEVARYESNLYTRTWNDGYLHEAITATRRAARADTAECAQLLLALLLADDDRPAEAEEVLGPPTRAHRDPRADILRASCALHRGDRARADELFHRALPHLGAAMRGIYDSPFWLADSVTVLAARAQFPGSDSEFVEARWKEADPTPATRRNERRIEQWDRMVWADLLFANPAKRVFGWTTEPGIAWVRYGKPRDRGFDIASSLGGSSMVPSHWTWTYRMGPELYDVTFYDHSFNGTFTLPWMTAANGAETPEQVLALLTGGRQQFFSEAEHSVFAMTASGAVFYDGAQPVFAHGIGVAAPWDTTGLTRRAKRHLPMLALGPYERQVAVFDSLWREVSLRIDTLSTARDWAAQRGIAVWTDTVDVPEGRQRVAVALRDLSTGAHADVLYDVAAPSRAPRLAVSDPLIAWWAGPRAQASHSAPGMRAWHPGSLLVRARDQAAVPNPLERIASGDPLHVYFEVYRPDDAEPSTVAITYSITPVKKHRTLFGHRSATTISSTTRESARGGADGHALEIDLDRLDPGAYLLRLTVRDDVTGAVATSTARFDKNDPDGKYGRWKLSVTP